MVQLYLTRWVLSVHDPLGSDPSYMRPSILSLFLMLSAHAYNFIGKEFRNESWLTLVQSLESSMDQGTWVEDSPSSWLVKRPCRVEPKFYTAFCALEDLERRKSYSWVPSSNSQEKNISRFSPSRLCAILEGRDVLIVGDSLSQEFYHTIVSTMLDNDTSANTTMRCAEDPSFWDRSQPWSEHLPCSPPFAPININYAWSTHLFLKEDENIGGKNVVREAKWVNAVALSLIHI